MFKIREHDIRNTIISAFLAVLLCAILCMTAFAAPLESAALPRIEGKHTIYDDVKAINPHYRDSAAYANNCTHCVISYELRRRGYDVEATPICKNDPGQASFHELFFKFKTNPSSVKEFVCEAEDCCLMAGCGARFIVIVPVPRNANTHALVLENVDGEAIWIDPQKGGSVTPCHPPDVEFTDDRLCDYYWVRIDTQTISAETALLFCKEAAHD